MIFFRVLTELIVWTIQGEKSMWTLGFNNWLTFVGSNNLKQTFPVIADQSGGLFQQCSLQNRFSWAIFSGCLVWIAFEVMGRIRRRIFFCWCHSVVDYSCNLGCCPVASSQFCWASICEQMALHSTANILKKKLREYIFLPMIASYSGSTSKQLQNHDSCSTI